MTQTTSPSHQDSPTPPLVYRAMKFDPQDKLPLVGSENSGLLGARPNTDITVDSSGQVSPGASGMSVAPEWRSLPFTRIPKRLRHIVPGAAGSDRTACFRHGEGPFLAMRFADGLQLVPDDGPEPIRHGVVGPESTMPFEEYQRRLAATRENWTMDEL